MIGILDLWCTGYLTNGAPTRGALSVGTRCRSVLPLRKRFSHTQTLFVIGGTTSPDPRTTASPQWPPFLPAKENNTNNT